MWVADIIEGFLGYGSSQPVTDLICRELSEQILISSECSHVDVCNMSSIFFQSKHESQHHLSEVQDASDLRV